MATKMRRSQHRKRLVYRALKYRHRQPRHRRLAPRRNKNNRRQIKDVLLTRPGRRAPHRGVRRSTVVPHAKRPKKGYHLSAAQRKKISEALKGKKHPHKGHKLSKATRAKISKALKGKHHHHKGHKMSAATRKKISDSLKKRARDKRARAKRR